MKDCISVSIRDLEVMLALGITESERARPQPVKISVTVIVPAGESFSHADRSELARTIDYAVLLQELKQLLAQFPPTELIESVGDQIIDHCMQRTHVEQVSVTLLKQEYAERHAHAEVTMTRGRA